MWNSPIYKLNKYVSDVNGNHVYNEIVIDVNKSAPPFSEPSRFLKEAFSDVISKIELQKNQHILDVGGGKLRNTLHFLGEYDEKIKEERYNVCAVEYETLFSTPQARSNKEKAKQYGKRFETLLYPKQFIQYDDHKFDLVILINVINIMPVPAERLFLLQLCHQKLKPGGYLFWYTQRGDSDYHERKVPRYQIGDGYFVGRKFKYKTFYREFTVKEIDSLLSITGFDLVCPIKSHWRNQARLYRRLDTIPLSDDILNKDLIEKADVVDERIPDPKEVKPREILTKAKKRKGHPDPEKLRIENLFIKKLESIDFGTASAGVYQEYVKYMLQVIFPDELRNLQLQRHLDIAAINKSKTGFFNSLRTNHQIRCPSILIECKNYRYSVNNPAFQHIGSHLGGRVGRFGILAYRRNRKAVIGRCRRFFSQQNKVILPLCDTDFKNLLKFRMHSQENEIERYMEDILLEII